MSSVANRCWNGIVSRKPVRICVPGCELQLLQELVQLRSARSLAVSVRPSSGSASAAVLTGPPPRDCSDHAAPARLRARWARDTLHDAERRDFASDNYAGAHPRSRRLVEANGGHQTPTARTSTPRACRRSSSTIGSQPRRSPCSTEPVQRLCLQSLLPRWGAVICAETAHIHTDENGAPERVGALKLLAVPTPDGKLTPSWSTQAWGSATSTARSPASSRSRRHRARNAVHARRDPRAGRPGARAGPAAAPRRRPDLQRRGSARCRCAPSRRTPASTSCRWAARRTVCSSARPSWCSPRGDGGLTYLRKMDMQLTSKMRFVSAQLVALYEGDLWLRSAAHANAMAARLGPASRSCRACRHPTDAGERRVRMFPTGVADGCVAAGGSTTGTWRPARCGSCARSTRPRRTSTSSSPRCKDAVA